MLTYSGEGPGENGKITKMKPTSEIKDKDLVVFKMYCDGKDAEMVTITSKRKKQRSGRENTTKG